MLTRPLTVAAALVALASTSAVSAGIAAYRVVQGWPVYPAGVLIGDGSGVAVGGDGLVLALHRANRRWAEPLSLDPVAVPTLIAFDGRTGRTVAQWGAGTFAMPHGLSTDAGGNVWVTDVALHQVFKLSRGGKVLLTLGERGVPGDDTRHFNRPTDVLVLPDGGFYVSDGYGNARIVKFDRDGRYEFEWGTPGAGPGQFRTPHSMALTSRRQLVVADRNNGRMQIFDLRGRFVGQWRLPGSVRPFAVAALPGRRLAVVGNAGSADGVPETAAGFVVDEGGRVLSRFGSYGRADGQFVAVHDVAADRAGSIYAVDVAGARVQKFAPGRPVGARR